MKQSSLFLAALSCCQLASGDIGKSTYAMSHPFAYKAFMEANFPTAENMVQTNSTTTCVEWVKLCLDVTSCSGPSPTVTQIHSVGAYKRDSGSHTMEELEGYFTQALGGLTKYDPFIELATGFHTADLDYYVKAFDAAKVKYFPSTSTIAGKLYHSVSVQIPGSLNPTAGSMLVMELVGTSSILASSPGIYHHPLPRFSAESINRAEARNTTLTGAKPALTFLKVSFPSSDLARDVKFFESVLKGTGSQTSANGTSMYAGKVLSSDKVEIHFVQSTQKTQGPMSVADWEAYQRNLHSTCVGNSTGFDRLADNHIGHMGMGDLDPYINAVKAEQLPYRFFSMGGGGTTFFYFYWPNGWGSQLIGTTTEKPTKVSGYNFCTEGTTGHCSADLPSDDDETR